MKLTNERLEEMSQCSDVTTLFAYEMRHIARELLTVRAAQAKPDYYIHRVETRDSYGPEVDLRVFNYALDAIKCVDDHGGDVVEAFTAPPAQPVALPDGWVKCSERIPADDTLCLGCDVDGVMWTLHFDDGQFMADIGILASEITHWMPLPAAPEQ